VEFRVPEETMVDTLFRILSGLGFSESRARSLSGIFTENSLDGVVSHGLNRFPDFVEKVKGGHIDINAAPSQIFAINAFERWDGNRGPGPLNALFAMDRAMALADDHGIGCVALQNTNHWMRGGTYGFRAAEKGYLSISFTNTTPVIPPWGGTERRLGNNPLIVAVPREAGPVVLDMALSQFSMGRQQTASIRGERLPVPGGYDEKGNLTDDPDVLRRSNRPLPIGYWKGSGLSLVLDLTAMLLTGGKGTRELESAGVESGISQVFIAWDLGRITPAADREAVVAAALEHMKSSPPVDGHTEIRYPGERARATRAENLEKGILTDEPVWRQVRSLL
jgi:3-dehydro-L-gulonate 2-dehydrogenase